METLETVIKQLKSAKRIAIALPQSLTIDILCAAAALQAALINQQDKPSVYLFSGSEQLPSVPFLAQSPRVANGLGKSGELVIKLSNQHAKPEQLRYETSPQGLTIYIAQSGGVFAETDVTVLPSAGSFDVVIMLGVATLEQLGTIYIENTKLFFETPTINIDINPANEFYGTVNLVNTTVTSLSELVMEVIEALPNSLQGDTVTTGLLAGIISQTNSFRDPKTTPSALQKASRLVNLGARQQDIIQHLFKTKPLPLLQLWGRALARLTTMPEKQMLMAIVTAADLDKTKVAVDSFSVVLRDIIEMVTGYSLVILLAELPGQTAVQVLLAGVPYENLLDLAQKLGASELQPSALVGKYQFVSFAVNDSLEQVQQKITVLIESRSSVV